MKGKIKESKKVIKSLDKKYNFFSQDYEMDPADNSNYSFNDGILCQVSTLKYIAYRKRYLNKAHQKSIISFGNILHIFWCALFISISLFYYI